MVGAYVEGGEGPEFEGVEHERCRSGYRNPAAAARPSLKRTSAHAFTEFVLAVQSYDDRTHWLISRLIQHKIGPVQQR